MARVNVEQKALTDPRFYRLGLELGADAAHAQAVGLHAMIRVWNECIERGKYILDGWMLQAVLAREDAPALITGSDLAAALKNNRFRIRGTRGRIEYLEEMRRNGREFGHLGAEHGKKGGRPRKPPKGVSGNPVTGIPKNPPPAPAPASEIHPPTLDDVRAYIARRGSKIDPERFFDHYSGNGWKRDSGIPIQDWQAVAREWEGKEMSRRPPVRSKSNGRADPGLEIAEQVRQSMEAGDGT